MRLYKSGKLYEASAFFSFDLREEPKNFKYLKGYLKTLICMRKCTEARDIFESLKKNYEPSDQINSLVAQLTPASKLDFFPVIYILSSL